MYLSGTSNPAVIEAAQHRAIGLMAQPDSGYEQQIGAYRWWAADNGCFAKGDAFNELAWMRWVKSLRRHRTTCLFVVAPDVVGNAAATLTRSAPWLPQIRKMGYAAAFVAQDGLEDEVVPWETFDALFIGGSTDYKLSQQATMVIREAKAEGKWCHMGRVNSQKRLLTARDMGCDSADGTFLKFGPDVNLPKLLRWLDIAEKASAA